MEIPNRFYRISIKALVLDQTRTKFLVVQEENGKWEMPGGGLDWGENPLICLKRELEEEMGLVPTRINATPSYFGTQKKFNGDIWYSQVVYETELPHLNFTPSEECVAVQFVNKEEAKKLDAFPNIPIFADMFDPVHHILK